MTAGDRFWSLLYWLARTPSIILQIGWEPRWRWANQGHPFADGPKGRDGREPGSRDEPKSSPALEASTLQSKGG